MQALRGHCRPVILDNVCTKAGRHHVVLLQGVPCLLGSCDMSAGCHPGWCDMSAGCHSTQTSAQPAEACLTLKPARPWLWNAQKCCTVQA